MNLDCFDFGKRVRAEGGEEQTVQFSMVMEEIPKIVARVSDDDNASLERQKGASILKEYFYSNKVHANNINKEHAKEMINFNEAHAIVNNNNNNSFNEVHAKVCNNINKAHAFCQSSINEGVSVLKAYWDDYLICPRLPLAHLREASWVGDSFDPSLDVADLSVCVDGVSEGSLGLLNKMF